MKTKTKTKVTRKPKITAIPVEVLTYDTLQQILHTLHRIEGALYATRSTSSHSEPGNAPKKEEASLDLGLTALEQPSTPSAEVVAQGVAPSEHIQAAGAPVVVKRKPRAAKAVKTETPAAVHVPTSESLAAPVPLTAPPVDDDFGLGL